MITPKDLLTRSRLFAQIACLTIATALLIACTFSNDSSLFSGIVLSSPFFLASAFEYGTRILLAKTAHLLPLSFGELQVFTSPYARLPYFSEKHAFITPKASDTYTEQELHFHQRRNIISRQTWSPILTWCGPPTLIFSGYSFIRKTVDEFIFIPKQANIYLETAYLALCLAACVAIVLFLQTKFDQKTIISHQFTKQTVESYLTKLHNGPNDFTIGIPLLKRLQTSYRLQKLQSSYLFAKEVPTNSQASHVE